MDQDLHLKIIYENNLDTDKFARMLDNKSQSYKFYWLEAILLLIIDMEDDLSFSFLQVCHVPFYLIHYSVSYRIHDVLKNGGLHKTVMTTIFNIIPLLQLLVSVKESTHSGSTI